MNGSNEDKELSGEIDLSSLSALSLEPSWASGDGTEKISVGRAPRDDDRRGNAHRHGRPNAGGSGFRDRHRPPRERDGNAPRDGSRAFGGEDSRFGHRHPRRERDGFGNSPRRDDRGNGGGHFHKKRFGGNPPPPRVVEVSFLPEEKPFGVLAKAVKNSARTYALFEIASLILEKPERFSVGVRPLERRAAGVPAKKNDAPAADGVPAPAAPTLFVSVPDGMPFLNEADVFAYVFSVHADKFFSAETVEVEPPKGNFSMVAKCGFTGELLAPPNYHAYQQILRDHHAANFPKMPFEKFMSRLETVRDQEAIDAWIGKMKTVVRYTVKDRREGEPETLDGAGAAKAFLLSNRKSKVVRALGAARIPGKLLEQMPMGPMKACIENELAFQRRFPLATANALRGRLRRAGFSLFKRSSKDITLVCAIRRKFRTPDSVFSDTIQRVFDFLDKHPNTKIQDLPKLMLGIGDDPAVPAKTDVPATEKENVPADAGVPANAAQENVPATEEKPSEASVPASEVSADAEAQLSELLGTVRWLILEGYVSELSDGTLFTHPKMTAAQAKAAAKEDAAPAAKPADAPSEAEEKPDDIAAGIPAPMQDTPDVPAA